jgi:TolB-like protein
MRSAVACLAAASLLSVADVARADETAPAAPTTAAPMTTAPATTTEATTATATATATPPVVAVLDLKAAGGADAQAQALTTMLTAEVAALPGLRAVSRNELRAVLTHQADAQLTGCAEVQCMADVAHLVSATSILSGEVQRLNGATALSLTLVDVASGEARVVARQEAAWRGSDEDLLLLARPLVQRLFDHENAAAHTGRVELLAAPGAQVVFDGKDAGVTPLAAPFVDVPTGAHRIGLRKDGFAPLDLDVVVARGETTVARGELREIPLTEQPWFWWTAGGVVLVAGGAAAGVTALAFLNQPTTVVVGKP